ncbi:MAG: MerR family DNA-binding protein [Luteitalea sp.]|nr:MerR family DNA-binding protein [Luteitalea sp.]
MTALLIGQLAKRAGVATPTIRYYESIRLLQTPPRSSSGYRRYPEGTVEELAFIKKAQALGFSLDEIREILELSRAGRTPCEHVLAMAHRHLEVVEQRIRQLQRFRDRLAAEVGKWNGKTTPTCRGLCQIIASADAGSGTEPVELTGRQRVPQARH